MNESRLETIEQIREFLAGTADLAFTIPTEEAKRRPLVVTVLRRFRYFRLAKGPRGVLFAYLQRLTGFSRQHRSRLIAHYRDTQSLRPLERANRTRFARKYSPADVALLAELDRLHDPLSGPATKVLALRAHAWKLDAGAGACRFDRRRGTRRRHGLRPLARRIMTWPKRDLDAVSNTVNSIR